MSQLGGKVQYLRGLADGMKIKESSDEGKLLFAIIDTLDEFARELDRLEDEVDVLGEVVDDIEDNIEQIEDALFEDEDDWDEEEDEEDGDGDVVSLREINEGAFIEYECPHCTSKIYYDAKAFDLSEGHICPDCGKELFPEEEEDKG